MAAQRRQTARTRAAAAAREEGLYAAPTSNLSASDSRPGSTSAAIHTVETLIDADRIVDHPSHVSASLRLAEQALNEPVVPPPQERAITHVVEAVRRQTSAVHALRHEFHSNQMQVHEQLAQLRTNVAHMQDNEQLILEDVTGVRFHNGLPVVRLLPAVQQSSE